MSGPIIDTSPQGSLEWHLVRAGVITASTFHMLRASARLKRGTQAGEYSSEAKNLAFTLGIERISKLPLGIDEGFEVWQANRGHGMEPHAKFAHELRTGILVETAGFIRTEDGRFGCSADGYGWMEQGTDLVRIGCEYKCYLDPVKLRAILLHGDTSSVVDQCEGGMWITGLSTWHFGLYCPALNPIGLDFTLIPIERDDDRIEALEADLWTFNSAVDEVVTLLRQRAGLNGAAPAIDSGLAAAAEVNRDLRVAVTELPDDIFN